MTGTVCGATCRDGHPCQKPPMTGQARCRLHGGRSPQAMHKAAERQLEERLTAQVATMAGEPITDPVRWLQDVAGEVAQWLRLCRAQLDRATSVEESGAVVYLYERALGRALDASDRMTRLGVTAEFLDARQARIGEQQAAEFVALLDAVCGRLDLTDEQRDQVPAAVVAAIDALSTND